MVDTETNGCAGDACELTEVGAVLVGGGELHDRWETLVGGVAPLSRAIQRFTQITQGMVDEAPAADAVLPDLAELIGSPPARVLVAHNAAFDRRVLRQAFERADLHWPDPPALCTVALARRFAPLVRQRRLAALADALGVEVHTTHRALADAETCARVFCALFGRLCAHAATVGDALEALNPRAPAPARAAGGTHDRAGRCDQAPQAGHCCAARRARRLHLPQRRRPGPLRRQVRRAAHARALALRDLGARRELDRAGRARRPPHDELRARRARARAPAHPRAAPARQRDPQARRRVRLPALPPGHRLPGARGRARARRRARGDDRPAAQPRRGGRAQGAARFAVRPAPLRPQAAAAAVAVGVRADGPLHVAVPERPRSEPLPPQARRGARAVHGRGRRRCRAARAHRRADARGRRRRAVRARRLAAPPPRADRGARARARRRAAGDARAPAARARPAPARGAPLRRVLARRRPRRRLGPARPARRAGRVRATCTSAPCARSRGPPAARSRACRPTRSPRRASCRPGWRATTRPRSSSTRCRTPPRWRRSCGRGEHSGGRRPSRHADGA